MLRRTFFICFIFLAITNCSIINELKRIEEEFISKIAKTVNEVSNKLEGERFELASEISKAYSSVISEMKDLDTAIANYESMAKGANKSFTDCYLDGLRARKIMAVNLTQILECSNYTKYKEDDSYIARLEEMVNEVQSVIPDCMKTTSMADSEIGPCASKKFQDIDSWLEDFQEKILIMFEKSNFMSSSCLEQSASRRSSVIFIHEELSVCVDNILKISTST